MEQRWLGFARELLSLPTSPLGEHAVAEWIVRFASDRGLRCRADRWGNLEVHYRNGNGSRRPFAFCAHMDHPGFIAQRTMRNGLLVALWRGSVPPELFPGASVRFFREGRWVRGRIVGHSGRHRTGKARPTRIEVSQPVEPGSVGMWDFPDPRMRGPRLYARGHDDVTGVAAIASLLDEVCRRKDRGEFYAFFTRAEESGFLGAIGASRSGTLPKRCRIVALETSKALSNARLGEGVIVRVGDKMTVFSPSLTQTIADIAEDLKRRHKSFQYQRRLMDGGTCESSVYGAYGYDAAGLCIPLGNYHNVNADKSGLGPEYVDVNDYYGMVRLLLALAVSGPAAGEDRVRAMCEDLFRTYGGELESSKGG